MNFTALIQEAYAAHNAKMEFEYEAIIKDIISRQINDNVIENIIRRRIDNETVTNCNKVFLEYFSISLTPLWDWAGTLVWTDYVIDFRRTKKEIQHYHNLLALREKPAKIYNNMGQLFEDFFRDDKHLQMVHKHLQELFPGATVSPGNVYWHESDSDIQYKWLVSVPLCSS